MLLAEEFALVAIDPDSGRPPTGTKDRVELGCAALLVAELGLRDRIRIVDPPEPDGLLDRLRSRRDRVETIDDSSTSDELLDHVLRAIRRRGPALRRVVERLGKDLGGVWDRVTGRLEATGRLTEEQERFLLLFSRERHRVTDRERHDALLERLRAAALADEPLDERTGLLLAMCGNCHLLETVAPERDVRQRVAARIKDVERDAPYGPLVKRIVDEQAAAVVAATTAATSS